MSGYGNSYVTNRRNNQDIYPNPNNGSIYSNDVNSNQGIYPVPNNGSIYNNNINSNNSAVASPSVPLPHLVLNEPDKRFPAFIRVILRSNFISMLPWVMYSITSLMLWTYAIPTTTLDWNYISMVVSVTLGLLFAAILGNLWNTYIYMRESYTGLMGQCALLADIFSLADKDTQFEAGCVVYIMLYYLKHKIPGNLRFFELPTAMYKRDKNPVSAIGLRLIGGKNDEWEKQVNNDDPNRLAWTELKESLMKIAGFSYDGLRQTSLVYLKLSESLNTIESAAGALGARVATRGLPYFIDEFITTAPMILFAILPATLINAFPVWANVLLICIMSYFIFGLVINLKRVVDYFEISSSDMRAEDNSVAVETHKMARAIYNKYINNNTKEVV